MSLVNLDDYNQLVAALYRGAGEAAPWQDFLQQLRQLCRARLVVLNLSRPRPDHPGLSFVDGVELSAESTLHYANEFAAMDPFVNLPDGVALTPEDMLSPSQRRQLRQSAYFQQYLAPADWVRVLGVDVYHEGAVGVYLRALRGQGDPPFGEAEKQLFNQLALQLRQLIQWLDRDRRREAERALQDNLARQLSMGMLLLDEQLRLLHSNPVGRHLLDAGDGLQLINRRLRAELNADNQKLQQQLRICSEHSPAAPALAEAVAVTRRHSAGPLYLLVKPAAELSTQIAPEAAAPRVAVYIRAPEMLAEKQQGVLQQLFGFTPSEAQLAIALANGMSLDDIAEQRCVSRNTLRSHLRGAFQKAGVKQQSALVSLVLRSVAGLG